MIEGVPGGIDGYPFLKHLIELWPGDREEHLGKKMNEAVFEIFF